MIKSYNPPYIQTNHIDNIVHFYLEILDDDADYSGHSDSESEGEEEPDEDEIIDELYGAEEEDKKVQYAT